jgi:hypothetical protein
VLSIRLCPVCGAAIDGGSRCHACGAQRNIRGWVEGEQPLEVTETIALLRGTVKMIPRQEHETTQQWEARVFDFTGHLHRLIAGDR